MVSSDIIYCYRNLGSHKVFAMSDRPKPNPVREYDHMVGWLPPYAIWIFLLDIVAIIILILKLKQ